jgi:hypothetical protein
MISVAMASPSVRLQWPVHLHGYAGMRLHDIAAAAGVTNHLLLQESPPPGAPRQALRPAARRLAEDVARTGPLAERLSRVTDRWFAYV